MNHPEIPIVQPEEYPLRMARIKILKSNISKLRQELAATIVLASASEANREYKAELRAIKLQVPFVRKVNLSRMGWIESRILANEHKQEALKAARLRQEQKLRLIRIYHAGHRIV